MCRTTKDDVTEMRLAKKQWLEIKALAQNRVRWQHFVDALCTLADKDTDDDDADDDVRSYY